MSRMEEYRGDGRPNPEPGKVLLRMCRMSGREREFIDSAFEGEWVVPLGPNVTGFERELEDWFARHDNGNRPCVAALSSGTAALHLALLMAGVGPGDEVIVQSFTFAASANPVAYLGATPVFVDSESATWNMSPRLLEKAIADRKAISGKAPKAIVVADLYGMPARLGEISSIAEREGIALIEDAAEALGSSLEGCPCGTFGRFGVLSFNGNKMITTSGGGALVCHSEQEKKRAIHLATQAREAYPFYHHVEIGYNYRLSNICAGIGRGQMTVLDDYLAHHRHRHEYYRRKLEALAGVRLHSNPGSEFDSNYWLSTIVLEESARVRGAETAYPADMDSRIKRPDVEVEALRQRLWQKGIETRPLWKPLHLHPVFEGCPAYADGTSEALFRRGLCLPSGPWVTDEDADRVVEELKAAMP